MGHLRKQGSIDEKGCGFILTVPVSLWRDGNQVQQSLIDIKARIVIEAGGSVIYISPDYDNLYSEFGFNAPDIFRRMRSDPTFFQTLVERKRPLEIQSTPVGREAKPPPRRERRGSRRVAITSRGMGQNDYRTAGR
jgi:hypothetical protein